MYTFLYNESLFYCFHFIRNELNEMMYVVHFLCFCCLYSYLTYGLFLSDKKFNILRRNVFDGLNNARNIKLHDVDQKIKRPSNEKHEIKILEPKIMRRKKYHKRSSNSDSSTVEKFDFQVEHKKKLTQLQFEALNRTFPGGDKVYMLAARPHGVPCGDPSVHDLPWGTCMLSMECDVEFRIYRGDYFCGRTDFVCCGILEDADDFDAPFDASFDSASLQPDSTDIERKKKPVILPGGLEEKTQRKEDRENRKKEMKSLIDKIVKEVRTLLNKASKNSSKTKAKKTRQLKLFLKDLKRQYKKDRQSVADTHTITDIRIDQDLRNKLAELSKMNNNFMKNETFRNILMHGATTMSRTAALMLMQAYPVLGDYLIKRKNLKEYDEKENPLKYDVEYGIMYY